MATLKSLNKFLRLLSSYLRNNNLLLLFSIMCIITSSYTHPTHTAYIDSDGSLLKAEIDEVKTLISLYEQKI